MSAKSRIKVTSLIVCIGFPILPSCTSNEQPSSPFLPAANARSGNIADETPVDTTDYNEVKTRWDVPGGGSEVRRGCLGADCIPSLEDARFLDIEDVTYLADSDLVYGVVINGKAQAYPEAILNWHEIINNSDAKIAITLCPLTGSGMAIDVALTGLEIGQGLESFGVSGLLYNNNLIPYDRGTGSNWSQMYLRCVHGPLRGTPIITVPLIETSWATWKKMFPESRVLSDETGFERPYESFPYTDYKTTPGLLFPITIDDARLPRKERVHLVISDRFELQAKAYRFNLFEGPAAVNDVINGRKIVVAGMKDADFYVSYSRELADGSTLTFRVDPTAPDIYPFDLVDNEGNRWNVLGEAISAARQGERLKPALSYNAFWFAAGAFFPGIPIY